MLQSKVNGRWKRGRDWNLLHVGFFKASSAFCQPEGKAKSLIMGRGAGCPPTFNGDPERDIRETIVIKSS